MDSELLGLTTLRPLDPIQKPPLDIFGFGHPWEPHRNKENMPRAAQAFHGLRLPDMAQ
jgi:hypothetical protein